ncbi:metabotropic glycine receptor isoform X4 [Drosophila sulfurigaster albostrigata]|uniref:metabotropic glycine receptor isoform X4 n=1 Tax=Drosophila sulfurigaster albostrigata TaxID=89887 RepID=UPI002D21B468|nr:metabotropic glycine receptor isoform X4 [Drosophila sulfurigaster albostrigata]
MNSSNKHKRNNFSDMELCIAIKSKAQSSMQKCHQNQMNQLNTQLSRQQHRSHINHRDRDHLKKQQENQRQTPQENQQHINRSNRSKTSITSIIIELIQNYCQRLCQLLLPLLMLLLLLGLAQPSAASPGSSSSSRRDALLAYYKRAQLRQSDSYGIPEYQQQQQQQQTLREAAAFDFEDLTPTGNVVSVLSNADRLRKRSATSTTAQTAAPTTTTTAAPVTTTVAATAAEAAASSKATEKCEPKVLETLPDEPFYDFSELAADAARQFTEFLTYKYANTPIPNDEQTRSEVSRRANAIASYALNEDENLLAFAIAAPSIHTVVVKFRDNVTIPPDQVHNKAYLGSYWRELGAAWNSSDGTREWGAPFRDCNLLTGRWLWPFRISFTEQPIKIVAAAFVAADEDVCNDGLEEVFGRRHGCDRNTTFCLLTENKPMATRDVYTCLCRESFYLPNSTLQGFRGDLVEMSEGYDNFSCVPCPGGCTNCDLHGVCLNFQEEDAINLDACLRLLVAIVLGACILCCVVLSVIVFRQRKCKAIASGMWTVLETILLGIVLLYASVAVHFFPASTERCLLEPWLREIGFITCYGAIILKLYRHLVDFRTRKAHRWVLRDVDLLKYLGTMVFAVVCYMAAFTASSLDLLESAQLKSLREASTNTCHPLKWELVTQTSEMLILCFGLHLAIASRNANTQFRERQFLVTTLTLEFLVSSSFYFLRFVYLPEMSPGAILLALFIRSQLTNSFALGLIFVPKLWYQHKQGTSHDAGQRLGGGYAGLCLGDPDIGELTISEMSPEDIRAELKRLYTQLEILKNKTLRQDNPHISKRRGGRKAGHRRFSLQALSAKHRSNKHHQDIEITEAEPSRTPEDSVCSGEGPTDTYAEISGISHSMLSHSMVSHSVVSHSK